MDNSFDFSIRNPMRDAWLCLLYVELLLFWIMAPTNIRWNIQRFRKTSPTIAVQMFCNGATFFFTKISYLYVQYFANKKPVYINELTLNQLIAADSKCWQISVALLLVFFWSSWLRLVHVYSSYTLYHSTLLHITLQTTNLLFSLHVWITWLVTEMWCEFHVDRLSPHLLALPFWSTFWWNVTKILERNPPSEAEIPRHIAAWHNRSGFTNQPKKKHYVPSLALNVSVS